ncbi:MAG TPA: hypothetical protein VLA88_04985 [Candidatus Saccharimonadales bacterium]|nr:hypothetical protein [Candidatus Saccharimonadales bacterium]
MLEAFFRHLTIEASEIAGVTGIRVHHSQGFLGTETPTLNVFVEVNSVLWLAMAACPKWQYPFDAVNITATVANLALDYVDRVKFTLSEMLVIGHARHTELVTSGVTFDGLQYRVPANALGDPSKISAEPLQGRSFITPVDPRNWRIDLNDYLHGLNPFELNPAMPTPVVRIFLVPDNERMRDAELPLRQLYGINVGWNIVAPMEHMTVMSNILDMTTSYTKSSVLAPRRS